MKKYKLTKITIKTREIMAVSHPATSADETTVCPVCHTPIPASARTLNEDSAIKSLDRQSTTELPPAATVSDRQNEQYEGD